MYVHRCHGGRMTLNVLGLNVRGESLVKSQCRQFLCYAWVRLRAMLSQSPCNLSQRLLPTLCQCSDKVSKPVRTSQESNSGWTMNVASYAGSHGCLSDRWSRLKADCRISVEHERQRHQVYRKKESLLVNVHRLWPAAAAVAHSEISEYADRN